MYCQKPLTHTVAEGQAVVEAVRRHGAVLQHGTQHRSEWAFGAARELIRGGYLGRLHTIRLGTPSGTQLPPQPIEQVPEGFDYDLWLGPARWAPFTTRRCFGVHSWYFISDYCVGYIAGWGVHHLDSGQHGHGADDTGPTEVRAKAILPSEGMYDTPIHYRVDYVYPDGVTMVCTDVLGDMWSQGAGFRRPASRRSMATPSVAMNSVCGSRERRGACSSGEEVAWIRSRPISADWWNTMLLPETIPILRPTISRTG